jgi:hypothetical protein
MRGKIISFALTTEALLAGRKTVTRRLWKDSHAARFKKGDICQAYDKAAYLGGKPVGLIRLTCDPYKERTCLIPASDWEAEGFAYMAERGILLGKEETVAKRWKAWKLDRSLEAYVVRFELVDQGTLPITTAPAGEGVIPC